MRRKTRNTFLKKQRAEKKRKAKQEKKLKKESRKNQSSGSNLEDMLAYVDEDGNIIPVDSDQGDRESSEDDETATEK